MHGLPMMPTHLPGVTRREFLLGSLAAMSLLATGCLSRTSSSQGLDFGEFVGRLDGMARDMVGRKDPDEEAYLEAVETLIRRLNSAKVPQFRGASPVESASCVNGQPLRIVYFRLQPGARIPPHDHRDYNGVVHVVEGSAHIQNYDFIGSPSTVPGGDFRVRKTRDEVVSKGQNSTLTRIRDNIHDIVAGSEGVTFMDVFTFFDASGHSRYLNIGGAEIDGSFEARWS